MIAVLPPDATESLLERVRAGLEARGWSCEVSRGRQETVVVVAGADSAAEVSAVLAPEVVADVLPLLPGVQYARLRRRRRVLNAIGWGLLVVILLGLGIPVLAFLRSPVDVLLGPEVVLAAGVDDVPPNSARLVRLDHFPVLLVHLEGMRYFALRSSCPHMDDCLLQWNAERQQVVCPCHGCRYDVYGNVVGGPSSVPLRSYGVELVGDDVYVLRDER